MPWQVFSPPHGGFCLYVYFLILFLAVTFDLQIYGTVGVKTKI